MNSDPTIRKLVQVAEQAQLPIHVPVVLGNECFIITQQDMRRIEDARIFSYNKLNSKGELVPMDTTECNAPSMNTCQQQFHQNTNTNQLSIAMLPEIIARAYNATTAMQQKQQHQQQHQFQQAAQAAMPDLLQCLQAQMMPTFAVTQTPITELAPAATLQQQLDWAKACGTMLTPAAMYPLHHTSATSTTEIARPQSVPQSNSTRRQSCTRACNTMDIDENVSPFSDSPLMPTSRSNTCLCARQQAKQRKMIQFGN